MHAMSVVGFRCFSILCLSLAAQGAVEAQEAPAGFDVQGHRGCRGLAPENTLPAFEKAIELGVTTLELDVQVTHDGVLVVHHDTRLNPKLCISAEGEKITRRPLSKVDYREIADLDCGSRRPGRFPDQTLAPGARIPRLEEVLELARDAPYPVWVSIEIKQPIGGLPLPLDEAVERMVSQVERFGLEERTIIQSKWGEVLAAVHERSPALERSLVVRIASARRWIEDGSATIVSRKYQYMSRGEVGNLQQQGIRVVPWTVNKPKEIQKLMMWGVDGIITDYPDRALVLLAK